MKSQERHELETNALAKLLAKWSERIAPYTSHLLFGVLAIVAVVAIWQLSKAAWSSRATEGWDRVTTTLIERNPDIDVLKATGEEYDNRLEGQLSKLVVADNELFMATAQFLAEKEQAMKSLGVAEQIYNEVATNADDALVAERARLGQARVLEIKGKIPEAIEIYKGLEGTFAAMGQARAELLTKTSAEEYSTWLLDAQGAIPRRPAGLGSPLDFGADSLDLPQGEGPAPPASGPLFGDELLKEFESIQDNLPETPDAPRPDRYEEPAGAGTESPAPESPGTETPEAESPGPESSGAAPGTAGPEVPAATEEPAVTEEPAADDGPNEP